MRRRMSFSAALAILEQRGVTVEHLGRSKDAGCLLWRVAGQELDKDGVIHYAEQVEKGAV
jgi:hypothetical protein